MTFRQNADSDHFSVDSTSSHAQLPAYTPTDQQNEAAQEGVGEDPHSRTVANHMTAEQEKAFLAQQTHVVSHNNDDELQLVPAGRSPEIQAAQAVTDSSVYRSAATNAAEALKTTFRGLQVPTHRKRVSSGFPYPDMFAAHGLSADDWNAFTSEITQAAQMSSKDWTVTIGAGLATFAVSGAFIGWLGVLPSFYVGYRLRMSCEKKKLRAAKDTGDLETKLLRWNQDVFAPKGFLVRLDLPGDELADIGLMDVFTKKPKERKCGRTSRCGRRNGSGLEGGQQEGASIPAKIKAMKTTCAARKVASRGRVVIIPLQRPDMNEKDRALVTNQQLSNSPLPILHHHDRDLEKNLDVGQQV